MDSNITANLFTAPEDGFQQTLQTIVNPQNKLRYRPTGRQVFKTIKNVIIRIQDINFRIAVIAPENEIEHNNNFDRFLQQAESNLPLGRLETQTMHITVAPSGEQTPSCCPICQTCFTRAAPQTEFHIRAEHGSFSPHECLQRQRPSTRSHTEQGRRVAPPLFLCGLLAVWFYTRISCS